MTQNSSPKPQKKGARGKNPNESDWRPATRQVRGGTNRSSFGETSEAMFLTSGYVYQNAEEAEARFKGEDDGYVYSRFSNPTVAMFEDRMALLEGAPAAKATATGMAAVTASMLCQLSTGDHVVAARALFGSCRYIIDTLLPKFGVEYTFVDGRENAQWAAAVRDNTKAFFVETPANPTLDIIDLKAVADIAHSAGARLIVDNVFATPILQRPIEFGADVVVYSGTKHLDGQGRVLGGVVLADQGFIDDHLFNFLRQTGPSLSPFNAWVLLKSLETLDLRVRQMCHNADTIAAFLSGHNKLSNVMYPGHTDHPQHNLAMSQMEMGGTVITFELKGGKSSAFQLANALSIIDISNNLGDSKSLVTHPATTTHQRLTEDERSELGISQGMLRISIGLEDPDDLKDDLAEALDAA
jgi:O-succinylhomoserine sulfhydrylase